MSFAIAFGSTDRLNALHDAWQARSDSTGMAVHAGTGLLVAATSEEVLTWSPGRRSVAIGLIVDTADSRPTAGDALPVDADEVTKFLRLHWGRYILAGSPAQGGHWLFRDPSAGQAANLCRTIADDHLAVSEAASAMRLGIDLGDVDAAFLSQWLAFPFLRTGRTGFARVSEVQPGELHGWRAGETHREARWTPLAFTARREPPDFAAAAAQLGSLLRSAIPVMLTNDRSPLLQLSGGLDSSIIAAALATAGQPFSAANYHGASADSDERRFARAAAQAAKVDLQEFAIPPASARPCDVMPVSFRPLPNPALRPLFGALETSVREGGADALVDGAGGDNLFCYLTTTAPVLDALRDVGLSGAFRTIDDLATLCGVTIWTAGIAAARKRLRGGSRPYWKQDRRFLNSSTLAEKPDVHPWLDLPPSTSPGTREHIEALVSIQHFLDRGQPMLSVPMRHPLMAQPLLEYCLGLPSWWWCRGGHDRAVARAAMADVLPPPIAARRTKGRIESLFLRTYRAQQPFLRDVLLGGELADRDLLDEVAITNYLLRPGDPADDDYVRLLEFAALEEWLRSACR